MNTATKIFITSVVCCTLSFQIQAQEPFPYWNEVQAQKKKDSLHFPAPNQILFIGSSSFTRWEDIQEYFPSYPILNRAFGGSGLVDLIRYRYDVLYPYQPRQVIIYCGENDFASSDTVSAKTVATRFLVFFKLLRAKYSRVPVAYVSMKPSPSRLHLLTKFRDANAMIQSYLSTQKHTAYINVFDAMLNADGLPIEDIFLEDKLHMNAKGYAIWKKIILPYIIKRK